MGNYLKLLLRPRGSPYYDIRHLFTNTDKKCLDVVTSGLNLILVTDENFAQFLESARGSSTKNGCREDDP